jgi:putative MATE family efflux protein
VTHQDLTQGDVSRRLTAMTLPMIGGILSIMSMNIVDTFYVAQLGTPPLAAMSFTIPVVSVLLSLAFGVGIGASSVIARAIGARETERVKSYTTQSIFIALCIAALFALAGHQSMDWLFPVLGAPSELMPLIKEFMNIWFLGSFVVVIPMVGNSALRAAGNTRIPGLIMFAVALTNVVLDPILIFGWLGAPRMELAGAALSTVIAYAVAVVLGLYYLGIRLRMFSWQACRHNVWSSWRAILRISIPAVGTNLIAPLSTAITTGLVAAYNAEAVAGLGVATRIEALFLVLIMGLSSIIGPFVGQNWGARRRDRVALALRHSFRFCLLWGALTTLMLWFVAEPVIRLFSDDAQVISAARTYLHLVPFSYFFLGVIMVSSAAANGMGDPRPSLLMSFLRLLGLYLPLALLLPRWLGISGVYLAISLANVLVGLGALRWSRPYRSVQDGKA